jgi:hypothetical protein
MAGPLEICFGKPETLRLSMPPGSNLDEATGGKPDRETDIYAP